MAITSRPDKKFDVRVTVAVGGEMVERRRRGIDTKGEARRIEEELVTELLNLKQKGWSRQITWLDAVGAYSEWKNKKVAYSTLASAKGVLTLHTSSWNERAIDSFTTLEIENMIEVAYDDESSESKRKLLGYIKDVFKRQIQIGNLKVNPCSDISYSKNAEKELIAMSRPEILHLLQEANKQNHPWCSIWRVVYELGLRSGEGLALKWTDIDFNSKRVSINKSYCSKSKRIGPTKNRKTRTLVMNEHLSNFLKELKLASGDKDFVLPQLTEWKRGEAAKILRAFQRDLKIRETNFHSLRASFITHLLLHGVPITKVQGMVGHSDLKTTQRYVRLIASDLDGATDSLAIDLPDQSGAQVLPIFKES
jgi:site-specific recombinase XerD